MVRRRPRGFTLIELLVVITIIVVLLALLAPALDRAIYEAELAMCGAGMHAAGASLTTYAAGQRRRYPYRKAVHEAGDWETARLAVDVFDDRPPLRDYMDINGVFNDPLNDKVDLANSHRDTFIYTPYSLWFGWAYAGERGMFKLGDRFAWRGERYRLLMSDLDMISDNGSAINAHPDDAGLMPAVVLQDEPSPHGLLVSGANVGPPNNPKSSISWYWLYGAHARGPVDQNHLTDDGAVHRLQEVAWEEAIPPGNERVGSVPWARSGGGWPNARVTVPKLR